MKETRFSDDSEIVAHFDCATTGCAVVEVSVSCGFPQPPLYTPPPKEEIRRVHPQAMRPPACPICGCVMEYAGFTAREMGDES